MNTRDMKPKARIRRLRRELEQLQVTLPETAEVIDALEDLHHGVERLETAIETAEPGE